MQNEKEEHFFPPPLCVPPFSGKYQMSPVVKTRENMSFFKIKYCNSVSDTRQRSAQTAPGFECFETLVWL
jgi:hypothetical protein